MVVVCPHPNRGNRSTAKRAKKERKVMRAGGFMPGGFATSYKSRKTIR